MNHHNLNRKKIFSHRFKRTSLVFLFIFLLVIPFQNCNKFESTENSSVLGSDNSTNNGQNSNNNGIIPTTTQPDSGGGTGTDPAAVAAENARQARCKANIKKPIITNAAAINNSIFNISSGLATDAGDANASENTNVTVDSSKGIINSALTTPQASGGDGCVYVTTIRVDAINEAGHLPVLSNAIDLSGDNAVTADVPTNFNLLKSAVTTNPMNNNNNTFSTLTLNLKMNLTQNNRSLRCVEGSVWYAVKVRVATQSLQTNAQLDSDPVYMKANLTNACWIQQKLLAATAYPLNAKAGNRVAMDGSWAAVLSQSDSNKGAVFMFNKNAGGTWVFAQKLVMSDAATGHNLSNLAINGNVLAVSNASFGNKGKVYIFKNSGASWTESQQITAYESTILYQQFGLGLALGSNVLVVGSPSHPKSGAADSDTGKAYAYNLNAGTGQFDYAQTIEGTNEPHFGFGKFILISGAKMFIGAPDSVNNSSGRAFVFNLSALWSQEMVLVPPASISGAAGFGAAIAYNGTALAVGAPLNDRSPTNMDTGSVYYYKPYTGAVFHTMNGPDDNGKFGTSIKFGSNSLYVGCPACGNDQSGNVFRKLISNIESATVANRNIDTYVGFSHDVTNTESFGQSIDTDGSMSVFVGAPSKDTPNLKSGAAYIYNVR